MRRTIQFPQWLRDFYSGDGLDYEPVYKRVKERIGYGVGLELLRPLDGEMVEVLSSEGSLMYFIIPGVFSGELPEEWLV